MSDIGYPLDMGEMLVALKKTLQLSDAVPYLRDVRIRQAAFWYWDPWNKYVAYLSPGGSPETVMAEDGAPGVVKYATHEVLIDLVMLLDNPYDEDGVIGVASEMVGIATFAAAVCDLLENNFLGLNNATQIEAGVPPTCEVPANGYATIEAEPEVWLAACRIIYRAQTRPFMRTGA